MERQHARLPPQFEFRLVSLCIERRVQQMSVNLQA